MLRSRLKLKKKKKHETTTTTKEQQTKKPPKQRKNLMPLYAIKKSWLCPPGW